MIVAIEGLIPDPRLSPSGTQPAAPPVNAEIYSAKWLREQQHQPVGEEPTDPVTATKIQPPAPQVTEPEPIPEPAPKLLNDNQIPVAHRLLLKIDAGVPRPLIRLHQPYMG